MPGERPGGQERMMGTIVVTEFPGTAAATLTGPKVPQTTAEVRGAELRVTAVRHDDGRLAVALDAGTAAALLDILRIEATEADERFRRGPQNPGDTEWEHAGSRGVRLRTLIDAADAATIAAGGAFTTYDAD